MKRTLSVTALALTVTAVALSATAATHPAAPTAAAAARVQQVAAMSAVRIAAPNPVVRPHSALTRAFADGHTDARSVSYSNNWSGHVANGAYQGLAGAWTVPTVQATTTNKYSSTWIGLGGNGNQQLIQTGTEEDSINGRASYDAWVELLPQNEVVLVNSSGAPVTVRPGDSMWSYIYRPNTAYNTWDIYLQDSSEGWYYSTAVNYAPGASVEWIHEATKVGGVVGHPPVFSTVTFTTLEYLSGNTWYWTGLTPATEVDMRQNGTIYATAGAPVGARPQHFSITYGS